MSNPDQQDLPPLNKRWSRAYREYEAFKAQALEDIGEGLTAKAQVWATLAVAASNVLAEPAPHCSKCCY
ncbi:hypothetical protein ACIBTV_21305 [Micromonospora sp. NPDC049366]|uniref:hypothetical protein n=1 Tax=Micromonospora sp. NPDC049366 TaxID=3364271 RepID=UPI0037BA74FC